MALPTPADHDQSFESEQPRQPNGGSRGWFLGLLLVAATLVAYQPAWNGEPVYDDEDHLTPPELRSLTGLARIWTQLGVVSQYYPLAHSAFWVEHKLWGDAMLGYHLVNILLHTFSALLLLRILKQLEVPGSLAGGGHLRPASGAGGVGGVDFGTEKHAVRSFLSRRGAGLPEV